MHTPIGRSTAPFLVLMMALGPFLALVAQAPMVYLASDASGFMTLQPTIHSYVGDFLGVTLIASIVAIPIMSIVLPRLHLGRTQAQSNIKGWHIGLILIAVWVFAFGGMAVLQGWFAGIAPAQVAQTTVRTPAATQPGQFVNYNVGVTFQTRNSFSGASENVESATIAVYHSNGRRLSGVGTLFGEQATSITAGTTATNVPVSPQDGDYLFVRVDPGAIHVPDPVKTLQANPSIVGAKWMPTATSSENELILEVQLSKLGAANYNINPSVTTNLLLSVIGQDVSLTLSAPSDQSTIGLTSGTDVYITWEYTAMAANNASLFARLWITSNQTAADFDVISITITAPGGQTVLSTNTAGGAVALYRPVATATTSAGITQFWRFFPLTKDAATDIGDTTLIGRSTSHADSILVRAHLKTTFTSSLHGATAVLNGRLMSAAGALQTAVTDSVVLQA